MWEVLQQLFLEADIRQKGSLFLGNYTGGWKDGLFRIRIGKEGVDSMEITDVRVRKVTKEGKMKAVVSITIDNEFVVHDIKVIEGEKGLFIAMPSRKAGDGEYRDIAHPINSEIRNKIQTMILEKYEDVLQEESGAAQEAVI